MSNRAIFLDRDDTIIEDPGYISHPDQVRLIKGVSRALIEFKSMGYKLIVVSNQSGVARGIITEKVLNDIHERLNLLLSTKGVQLDAIYYCPYHPDGVIPKYRRESDNRKPNPGMILRASREMDIDLDQSWVIGNSSRDIEAGFKAGCKTILIENKTQWRLPNFHKKEQVNPDYRAINMKEALNIIKRNYRLEQKRPIRNRILHRSQKLKAEAEPENDTNPKAVENKETEPAPIRRSSRRQSRRESRQASETTAQTEKPQNKNQEQLLEYILQELKNLNDSREFGDFSIIRLLAGVLQMITIFVFIVSLLLLIQPDRNYESILLSVSFAIVLQLMSLTLYVMQGRK